MNAKKCITLEEAASLLSLDKEELVSKSHEILGLEEPAEFSYEDLESLILKSRIKITADAADGQYVFEFLRKESLDSADVYFVLVEDENCNESASFFLEIRLEKEIGGIIELIGILKNLLREKEIRNSSLVTVKRDFIMVSELFNDFQD